MKTILTIGGDSYVIPQTTDLHKVLAVLKGLTEVRSQTVYGPEDHSYENEWGYCTRQVLFERPAKLRVELTHDDEVCTEAEFELVRAESARMAETQRRKEEAKPKSAKAEAA